MKQDANTVYYGRLAEMTGRSARALRRDLEALQGRLGRSDLTFPAEGSQRWIVDLGVLRQVAPEMLERQSATLEEVLEEVRAIRFLLEKYTNSSTSNSRVGERLIEEINRVINL